MIKEILASLKDEKIKKALVTREPDAIDALFESYSACLYSYALSFTRKVEDAEEIIQNIFLRLARNPDVLKEVRNFKAYLYKAVRNESLNFISQKQDVQSTDDLLITTPLKNSDLAEHVFIDDSLKKLPPDQLEVIVLKLYQEMTFKEISELLDLSINTAASRYRYAVENLRKILEVN